MSCIIQSLSRQLGDSFYRSATFVLTFPCDQKTRGCDTPVLHSAYLSEAERLLRVVTDDIILHGILLLPSTVNVHQHPDSSIHAVYQSLSNVQLHHAKYRFNFHLFRLILHLQVHTTDGNRNSANGEIINSGEERLTPL